VRGGFLYFNMQLHAGILVAKDIKSSYRCSQIVHAAAAVLQEKDAAVSQTSSLIKFHKLLNLCWVSSR
jgi:hypothetical protein